MRGRAHHNPGSQRPNFRGEQGAGPRVRPAAGVITLKNVTSPESWKIVLSCSACNCPPLMPALLCEAPLLSCLLLLLPAAHRSMLHWIGQCLLQ
ncbi:hypothetical protein E2C01_100663 [Portunus trituberculatus]|uniref:Uncharacterized protein n=1 Tax=Portunus trituberculatus TaxID=210409 RepID=A0A5B7KIH9_PORTR|nr:hypothetical protein [Portunus trituberculatus]